jgi:hypothetical protein
MAASSAIKNRAERYCKAVPVMFVSQVGIAITVAQAKRLGEKKKKKKTRTSSRKNSHF